MLFDCCYLFYAKKKPALAGFFITYLTIARGFRGIVAEKAGLFRHKFRGDLSGRLRAT
jgi:hypothetical protein